MINFDNEYGVRLNNLKSFIARDHQDDAQKDPALEAAAHRAKVYASLATGLPLPAQRIPIYLLTGKEIAYVIGRHAGDYDGEGEFGATEVSGEYMLLATPFDPENPMHFGVLVHEMVHFVQALSGQRRMGTRPPYGQFNRIEYEAYKAQAQWLWEHGVNPRAHIAMGPMNMEAQTGSKELASLEWLDGYACSPAALEEPAETRWMRENPPKKRDLIQEMLRQLLAIDRRDRNAFKRPDADDVFNHLRTSDLADLDAIILVQGGSRDSDEYYEAFQHLVDNSLVSTLGPCYVDEYRDLVRRGKLEPRHY